MEDKSARASFMSVRQVVSELQKSGEWAKFDAVASKRGQSLLHRLAFVAEAEGRPESDDRDALMNIGRLLRKDPTLSVYAAVRRVVWNLPCTATADGAQEQVQLRDRLVLKSSLTKSWTTKYNKQQEYIQRCLDDEEEGQRIWNNPNFLSSFDELKDLKARYQAGLKRRALSRTNTESPPAGNAVTREKVDGLLAAIKSGKARSALSKSIAKWGAEFKGGRKP